MAVNSRAKGVRGELEARNLLRDHGFFAERGQQHSGGNDSPDVKHDMEGFHIEVKRVEALNIYNAVEQAERDRRPTEDAIVLHRKDRKPWLVTMTADTFFRLAKTYIYEQPKGDRE